MSRWPLHQAPFWQEAPLFRPLLALIGGIICYDTFRPAPPLLKPALAALIAVAALLAVFAFRRRRTRFSDLLFAALQALCFGLVGCCAYAVSDITNRSDWFGHGTDTSGVSIVRLLESPKERSASSRVTVSVLYCINADRLRHVSGKALLYVYRTQLSLPLARGDTLLVRNAWQPVQNSGNPFAFDNARFQRRKGILHQQFIREEALMIAGKAAPDDLSLLDRMHRWCNDRLNAYLPDSTSRGLLQAMLLGDESGFDPALREAYAQTGVVHIVSISGSHVAVLFLLVNTLLGRIRGRFAEWIRYAVAVTLVWMYVLIAGAPPSALRSAVMFSVIALGTVSGREGQSLNTVFAAAFILLTGEPAWLFSVGFQLSFGAVLSILLFYKPIYSLWPQSSRAGRMLWQAVSASVAAELLTAPLVIFYFHNFPVLFIIANLLAAVLVGFCALAGGMAIIALFWIPPIAQLTGWAVSKLVWVFNTCIITLQRYNPPSLEYLQISASETLLLYLMIAGAGIVWLNGKKWGLTIALCSACGLLGLLCADRYQAFRQDRLIVYSNGRLPLAERIRGPHFISLAGTKAESYHTRAAHTGWHAWRCARDTPGLPYLKIKGYSVLLLQDTAINAYSGSFPVDILIICRSLRMLQPGSVLRTFRPHMLVLARPPSAYHLQRWRDSCAAYGSGLHSVAQKGAYIIE